MALSTCYPIDIGFYIMNDPIWEFFLDIMDVNDSQNPQQLMWPDQTPILTKPPDKKI